ncbi:MAG: glycosyltransferase [Rhizobiaceae bacterium]|nr:glycosyltransferase [Rhizobiaceae bacterium]
MTKDATSDINTPAPLEPGANTVPFQPGAEIALFSPGTEITSGVLVYAASTGLDPAAARLAVLIPTFKRPAHLVETLVSIAPQLAAHDAAFVIVENDADGREGAKAAAQFLEAHDAPGLIVVAVAPGNCNAYNAGFAAITGHLPQVQEIAICDDDETASPQWLAELTSVRDDTGADIAGGPQVPVLPEGVGGVIHPVFRPAHSATGPVDMLYSSGNVLIGRHVLDAMPAPWLDPMFNFTGGGDTDFFTRCKLAGFRFAWSTEAILHESVPPRRLEPDWLRARALRNGALSAIIERRAKPGMAGRLMVLAKSMALLGASPLRALAAYARTGSAADARYRIDIGLGRMMGELGWINEQYRAPEKN